MTADWDTVTAPSMLGELRPSGQPVPASRWGPALRLDSQYPGVSRGEGETLPEDPLWQIQPCAQLPPPKPVPRAGVGAVSR